MATNCETMNTMNKEGLKVTLEKIEGLIKTIFLRTKKAITQG